LLSLVSLSLSLTHKRERLRETREERDYPERRRERSDWSLQTERTVLFSALSLYGRRFFFFGSLFSCFSSLLFDLCFVGKEREKREKRVFFFPFCSSSSSSSLFLCCCYSRWTKKKKTKKKKEEVWSLLARDIDRSSLFVFFSLPFSDLRILIFFSLLGKTTTTTTQVARR